MEKFWCSPTKRVWISIKSHLRTSQQFSISLNITRGCGQKTTRRKNLAQNDPPSRSPQLLVSSHISKQWEAKREKVMYSTDEGTRSRRELTRNLSRKHAIKLLRPCNDMYPHLHMTKVLLYLSSIGESRKLFSCRRTVQAIVGMICIGVHNIIINYEVQRKIKMSTGI